MAAAATLLRRYLRRRLPSQLRSPFISSIKSSPLPNSQFSLIGSGHGSPWNSRLPSNSNLHPFSSAVSCRNISWISWRGGGGGDGATDGSEAVEEVSSVVSGYELESKVSGLEELVETKAVESAAGVSLWDHPVNAVISMLDGFHEFSGLPWWAVISASTVALRLSLLPVLLLQLKKTGQIAALYPKLPPPWPPPSSGRSIGEQFSLFRKARRELGCPSFLWSFAFFTVQFPCFLLWMTSIRRMCLDHHTGFDCGGILWFQNLTDYPHGVLGAVLPISIAALHYINVQVSFRTLKIKDMNGILGLLAKYYKLYLDVLALPLVLIGHVVPQGSLVYWATNGSLTLIQQLTLGNSYVRKKLGLPEDMRKKISSESSSGFIERMIPADSLSPEKLLEFALEELAQGHEDTALPLLRIAIEKDPEFARALVALGQIFCNRKSFSEAIEHFECAISKAQENDSGLLALAYYGAGFSHILQGNRANGIEHLKKIAHLEVPDNPMEKACYFQGLVFLGSTLFEIGEKSEAAKYLRIAAAYDPAINAYVEECEKDENLDKKTADCP